ncbi:MAG: DAK2 domain-containing protein [Clostridia bacterium]|nr:DAK2 domain-containing protein [Clostridia bacterium]
MQFLNVSDMQAALLHTASVIIENEPMLTELDTRIGDGDHGIGMKAGFQALEAELSAGPKADFYSLFRESGITLLRAMGGASGVILCTLLLGGVDALREIDEMDARMLAEFFEKGVEAVRRRGRARRPWWTRWCPRRRACAPAWSRGATYRSRSWPGRPARPTARRAPGT